jgi:hypothetical protein
VSETVARWIGKKRSLMVRLRADSLPDCSRSYRRRFAPRLALSGRDVDEHVPAATDKEAQATLNRVSCLIAALAVHPSKPSYGRMSIVSPWDAFMTVKMGTFREFQLYMVW